jgi:hypothetical protein
MKNLTYKIKITFLSLVLSLATISCQDFLVENPQNTVSQSNYYQTEQDAIAAVNAIYSYLGSYNLDFGGPFAGNTAGAYHSTFWITADLASDNMKNNQLGAINNDQLANFSYNSDNANLLEIWRVHYKIIYLANIAVSRIPGINMNETTRDRLVNEAKFLRGLMYFNLVRMFGKVPLLIGESNPLKPESVDSETVYAQIVTDLKDASGLPKDGQIQEGRATQGAAQALLAKVYLTQKDFANASAEAKKVIDSNVYSLWDNYADAFKLAARGGKEAIFSVGFGDGGGTISFWEVGQFNVRLLPVELSRVRDKVSNTQGWQTITKELHDSYLPADKRKAATYMTSIIGDDGKTVTLDNIYIKKYWDEVADPTAGGSTNDFPVIRYSDVLLMYAEAQAELGNFPTANEYMNKVKNRAGLAAVNITAAEAFREAILDERRKEFVGEGQRWFDLVRMNKLNDRVHKAKDAEYTTPIPVLNENYQVFPIPQQERDVNPNLPQNPGF